MNVAKRHARATVALLGAMLATVCAACGPVWAETTYYRAESKTVFGADGWETALDVFFHIEGPAVEVPASGWVAVLEITPMPGATGSVVFNPPEVPDFEPNLNPASVDAFTDFDLDHDGKSYGKLQFGLASDALHANTFYFEPETVPPPDVDAYGNLTLPDGAGLFAAPIQIAPGTVGAFLVSFVEPDPPPPPPQPAYNVVHFQDGIAWPSAYHEIGTHVAGMLRVVEPTVVGRYALYNNSHFDGNDPLPNPADDAAIATDKTPLLPGETATFDNYTSYARGINGIVVDVDGIFDPGALTVDDFLFHVGNTDDPDAWPQAPTPTLALRQGRPGGTPDRVTLLWEDNQIENRWLRVTVLANGTTGLEEDDVFYFGNAVGETGNDGFDVGLSQVNAGDVIGAGDNARGPSNPAGIDDPFDFNRDRLVDAADQLIARDNATGPLSALRLIDLSPAAPPPAPVPEPATGALAAIGLLGMSVLGRRRIDRLRRVRYSALLTSRIVNSPLKKCATGSASADGRS